MQVFARRASAILYRLLIAHPRPGAVLLPANVCPIVPVTVMKAGRPVEFVDISDDTLAMDAEATLARLRASQDRYAAVVLVRTYGALPAAGDFLPAVKRAAAGILTIDDRCLCNPDFETAPEDGVDAVLWSTGYAKPVDIGFGGFAAVREGTPCPAAPLPFDPAAAHALDAAYKQAVATRTPFHDADTPWLDTSPPAMSFAAYRDRVTAEGAAALRQKRLLNRIYADALPEGIALPDDFHGWRYQIRVPNRDALLARLRKAGLFASGHYASLAGIFGPGEAPNAARLAGDVVNLFNDRYYTEDQATRSAGLVREHLAAYGAEIAQ